MFSVGSTFIGCKYIWWIWVTTMQSLLQHTGTRQKHQETKIVNNEIQFYKGCEKGEPGEETGSLRGSRHLGSLCPRSHLLQLHPAGRL